MAGDKTEKATPKRKQDERKKGHVFKSDEVVIVASLFVQFYLMQALAQTDLEQLSSLLSRYFSFAASAQSITPDGLKDLFVDCMKTFAIVALPVLAAGMLTAIILTLLQTRMLFSSKNFAFKAERLNPLSGLKKLFSMRNVVELIKSIFKIAVVLYMLYTIAKDQILLFPRLFDLSFKQAIFYSGSLIMLIIQRVCIAFAFLAAADYLYQWWEYEKSLRMSKQEIKDEYKQLEGDPQIKGRIRSIQQQRAQRRMMQKVPQADVVIRNPTHYAVALKYEQSKNRAPVVIAKGADQLALRIVKVAEEHGVYVTENRPLARSLYDAVDINQEIPETFYKAIAQILAFVYGLKKKEIP